MCASLTGDGGGTGDGAGAEIVGIGESDGDAGADARSHRVGTARAAAAVMVGGTAGLAKTSLRSRRARSVSATIVAALKLKAVRNGIYGEG
jgi:hypothetical protein